MDLRMGCKIATLTVAAAGWIGGGPLAVADDAMPVAQQNQLVQKYCAVCHTDAIPNGALSLQHFDAANVDPGVAAMILSKLKTGAMGAAGVPVPNKATQEAWTRATAAEAEGADRWVVHRTQSPVLTASIVREVPNKEVPDSYRLILTCNADTHQGEMQLTWAPGVPKNGQVISALIDGSATYAYKVEGTEKMGNGGNGSSGPGSLNLYSKATQIIPLPKQTLTISNAFPGETVEFPVGELAPTARKILSACF